jgi:ribosome-binding factor A
VRHRNRRWKGRARDASAEVLFERALLGESGQHSRSFDPRKARKTLQLCRQVQRTLMMTLDEEMLGDLSVESVEPMGGPSQLLVRIVLPDASPSALADATARLQERSAALRARIAQSISRKRTPSLNFVVVPSHAAPDGGVNHDEAG